MNVQARDVIEIGEGADHVPAPALAPAQAGSLAGLIERALIDPSYDIGKVERLYELYERAQDKAEERHARRAFNEAIANAKAEIGPIQKNKHVGFESKRTDSKTSYSHETFAAIAVAVDPPLSKFGLSYRFRSSQDAGKLRVTCVLSHRGGYSEETMLECGYDTSGNKNAIQSIGSAATYLERYTLKLALGLSAADKDDDGKATSEPEQEPELVSSEQIAAIQARIAELGVDPVRFRNHIKVETIADIRADKFVAAMNLLNERAAAAKRNAK